MIEFEVPGLKEFKLENLVLDYNGTIANDGELLQSVKSLLATLSAHLKIYVVTADTFGKVNNFKDEMNCEVHILPAENQAKLKSDFVEIIGAERTVAIGNGTNDSRMLKISALGIAVIEKEGASTKAILNADIVCNSIIDALSLLLNPQKIIATFRE